MKSLNLLIGDPAKAGDSFGVVGMQGTWPERKIYVRHAIEFKREKYSTVANHFESMNKKINFHLMMLEKNFDYEDVSKAFSHLPIKYVSTSAGLTEETNADGWVVDKPFMIKWLKTEYKKHTVQYHDKKSDGIAELINQRNQIVGITSPSGHVSYKRQRGRHDDLFMCELIGCNAIRIWWDQQR